MAATPVTMAARCAGAGAGRGPGRHGRLSGHGSWATPQGALVSWAVIMDGGVQVNRLGRRFHDETQGYSEAAVRVLAQPDGVAWNVFDDQALALVRDFPDFQAARAAGALRSADDAGAGRADRLRCAGAGRHAAVGSRMRGTSTDAVSRAPCPRHITRSRSPARVPYPGRLGSTTPLRGGRTAACSRICWRRAARGVCRATMAGYLSGNGLLSAIAGGHIAAATAAGSRARRWPMSRLRSVARPQACA